MQFTHIHKSESIHISDAISTLLDAEKIENQLPYSTPYASLSLAHNTAYPIISDELQDAHILVLIGIGGSNLGTLAVIDALRANHTTTKRIISLDTVDTYDILEKGDILESALKSGKKIILTAISKSGKTAETIGIFEYLSQRFEVSYGNQVYKVTISDPHSALDTLSEKEGWIRYNLPQNVGGRYSVFSHVGLFPLLWMGVDIETLLRGAQQALSDIKIETLTHPSAIVASSLASVYPERNIFEHFYFAKHFENVGKWYRQLLAESIGKVQKDGMNSVGITPTTSIGTTDLHSVAQLDLSHTRDRSLAIVSLSGVTPVAIGESSFASIVDDIRGKTFQQIMSGAEHGLTSSLDTKDIPYFTYTLRSGDAADLGYFLQTKMIEVILLGILLEVNPFDQPNVEEYKIGMRAYLSR